MEWQPKKFSVPKIVKGSYPVGEAGGKDYVTVNWLLNDAPITGEESLKLNVLDHLLMGTTKSALRKALSDSGLGEDVTGGGLSDELLQATFSVGMKGVDGEEGVEKVRDIIEETLQRLAQEGFEEEDVKASMNAIEFQLREFNTGSFPKGLSLMLGSISGWIYGKVSWDDTFCLSAANSDTVSNLRLLRSSQVIITIRACGWVLTKKLAWMMMFLYAIFVTFSLLLEYCILISCPCGMEGK